MAFCRETHPERRELLLEALESYRKGLREAPILDQWMPTSSVEPSEESAGAMTFVLSTDDVDRHGDIISADGWLLEAYRSNPVFLWAHDHRRPPIGRAAQVWSDAHRLLGRMEFAPTAFAQEVAALYRGNYQRGISVGFKPVRYEERRHDKTGAFLGLRFLEQELLEVSAVAVPANRGALLRESESAGEAAYSVGRFLAELRASAGL